MSGNRLYLAGGVALLAALLAYCLWANVPAAFAAAPSGNLSEAINATGSYIEAVNQSAYLIFYPNLTQAYGYYSAAVNASAGDPAASYALLAKARQSAGEQLDSIYAHRTESLYVLVAMLALLSALLMMAMKPYANRRRMAQRQGRTRTTKRV